jgi:hypothetical protein
LQPKSMDNSFHPFYPHPVPSRPTISWGIESSHPGSIYHGCTTQPAMYLVLHPQICPLFRWRQATEALPPRVGTLL